MVRKDLSSSSPYPCPQTRMELVQAGRRRACARSFFSRSSSRKSFREVSRAREKDFLMNSLDFEIGFVAVRVVNIGSNCLQLRYVKEVCRQGLWENQSGIWRVHSTPDLLLCQEMQLKGRCSNKEGVERSLTSKAISNKGFVQRSEGIGQRRSENNTSPRARATDNTLTVQTDEKVPPPYDMRTLTPRLWPCC